VFKNYNFPSVSSPNSKARESNSKKDINGIVPQQHGNINSIVQQQPTNAKATPYPYIKPTTLRFATLLMNFEPLALLNFYE